MLTLEGNGSTRTCDGVTRRDFMQVGALGAIGLSMSQYLQAKEHGHVLPGNDDKACIMIFNLGAPSQLDLFDMKPDAASEVRGPFQPISTSADGVQISEILPKHAKIADKFSLVRSCHHTGAAVHDAGWQMMQTGTPVQWRGQYAPRRSCRQLPAGTKNRPAAICRLAGAHGPGWGKSPEWTGGRILRQSP